MGSPSFIDNQNIELEETKIKEFKESLNKKSDEDYWREIEYNENDRTIEINLDEYKIIQYWYKEFLEFLKDIANFIEEGYICLHCPDYHEYAEIYFEKGECWLNLQINSNYKRTELNELRQ